MKNLRLTSVLHSVLAVFSATVLLTTQGGSCKAADPLSASGRDSPAAFPDGLRIFSIGHSFHGYVPAMLQEMANAGGIKDTRIVGMSIIGGSKVAWHWGAPEEKNQAKEALASGQVDVLTTTPIYLPDDGIEKFARLGLEHNPNLRITVQEFWLPFDQYNSHFYDPPLETPPPAVDHNAATVEALRRMHQPYFNEMDAFIQDLNHRLGKQALFIVPVGQAVIALRERIIAGKVPGLTTQEGLFTDALGHPKPPLAVLVGYCHYAVIFRKSPVGLPLPSAFAQSEVPSGDQPALNRLLQELAWDAVTYHPLSGVEDSSWEAQSTPKP